MLKPGIWIILLTSFIHAHGAFAERTYRFMLADIEPYVIRGTLPSDPFKGLQVEILQLLARKTGHRINIAPIPTRRYLAAAFNPTYEGAIYSDLLVACLPMVRANYDVIGPLFRSSMILFRRTQRPLLAPASPIPAGTVGQVGNSCGPFLKKAAPHLKMFDINNPDQGVRMMDRKRLDYLCLSDIVFHRLMQKQGIQKSEFEILRDLGGFDLLLLLHKSVPEADKGAFRVALRSAHHNNWYDDLYKHYQARSPALKNRKTC